MFFILKLWKTHKQSQEQFQEVTDLNCFIQLQTAKYMQGMFL